MALADFGNPPVRIAIRFRDRLQLLVPQLSFSGFFEHRIWASTARLRTTRKSSCDATYDTLSKLMIGHLTTFPYENTDMHLYGIA